MFFTKKDRIALTEFSCVITVLLATLIASQSLAALTDRPVNLSAESYVVIKHGSGKHAQTSGEKTILAHNENKSRSIASLSKLFAAVVVSRNHFDPSETIVTNREDHQVGLGGSRTRLELNWTYRTIDLLYAALIASDNRAVSAIGRSVGLPPHKLTKAMNQLAKQVGLSQTHFEDPVGINPNNRSTAKEVAKITQIAAQVALLRKVMSTAERYVIPVKGYINVNYRNTNPEVHNPKQARFLASKTGYNSNAGYCLAATVHIGHATYTYVILGSGSKYERILDQRKIIKYLSRRAQN